MRVREGSIVERLTNVTKPWGPFAQCSFVWLVLMLASTGIAAAFGVPIHAALSYAAYVVLYVILPGVFLYGLASTTSSSPIVFAAKAAVVGQCVEMSAGLAVNMSGAQAIYPWLAPFYLAGIFCCRRRILGPIGGNDDYRPGAPRLLSLAVALFLVFAASLFNFDRVIDQHFTWIAAFASAAASKWPIGEPYLMDVPLHYHYLFNVHVEMAAKTFHVPLILVASRLAIVFHAFLFLLTLYAFCEARFKAGWLGSMAATQMLLTFGYSAVMWNGFHLATASIMYRVASTIVAFELFLVLCDEIIGHASPRDRNPPYALIVFMMLVASGTRAPLLPMLAGGIGLSLLTHLRLRHERRTFAALLSAALVAIVAGAVFFLGFGSGESDGTRLLFVSPLNLAVAERAAGISSPIVDTLIQAGVPRRVTVLTYVAISILGRMTFLLPGAIFTFISAGSAADRKTRTMFGGVILAGIAMLVVVESVVPQEIWAFYWFADISLAVLGAAGLHALWTRRATSSLWIPAALVLSALLFAIQLWDFSSGFVPKLMATPLPTPIPVFRDDPAFAALLETLDRTIAPGDVLVTGGRISSFDERLLPAAIPGLRLYAARYILRVYGARVTVDPRVASRMWLIENDLSAAAARRAIRDDVGADRALYLLWVGEPPSDLSGLAQVGNWSSMSLWRVE
jgi:hypothetical protein